MICLGEALFGEQHTNHVHPFEIAHRHDCPHGRLAELMPFSMSTSTAIWGSDAYVTLILATFFADCLADQKGVPREKVKSW